MKNPWTRKNPFLSMWLSGANAISGAARGHAARESRRQAATAYSSATRQATDFWVHALTGKPPAKRKRKQR
jgi:hypothetical protein